MIGNRTIVGRILRNISTPSAIVAAAAICALGVSSVATAQCQSHFLTSPDMSADDSFGSAMAFNPTFNILLVGSPNEDPAGVADAGAVYAYTRSGAGWQFMQRLSGVNPPIAGDSFGAAVAMRGNFLLVGAPNHDRPGALNTGCVWLYQYNSVQQQFFNLGQILGTVGANFRYGSAVDTDGVRLAVGAPFETGGGAVYIYHQGPGGWEIQQRIQPAGMPSSARFGGSVSIEGDRIVVGAEGDNSNAGFSTGAVYVFTRNSESVWNSTAKLTGLDTASSDQFGRAVMLRNNRIIVGAPFADQAAPGNTNSGAVYAFIPFFNGWAQENKFNPPVLADSFGFGGTIALSTDGSKMMARSSVGSTSRVDTWNYSGGTWTAGVRLSPSTQASTSFGSSLVFGNEFIIGDRDNDPSNINNAGAVYTFDFLTPEGETCQNAIELLASHGGCTTGRTADGTATCGNSNSSPDVWYTYTAPCTGPYAFSTAGSSYDTVLSMYASCGGVQLGCNDDFGDLVTSRVTRDLVAGETIKLRVAGFNGASGRYILNATQLVPSNDSCGGALEVGEGAFTFGNCTATTDGPSLIGCGSASARPMHGNVWYRYTPSCNGVATIDTCGANFDTRVTVFMGDFCPSSTASLIVCDDDSCTGSSSRVEFEVQAGTSYLVSVSSYFEAQRGSGTLTISLNNACPADYNGDGGVDGSDVGAFFEDWEEGLSAADVNCDGGIDGSDVDAFFAAWENGGC
jgi:hypothetical protein